jgi:hypothetical protein
MRVDLPAWNRRPGLCSLCRCRASPQRGSGAGKEAGPPRAKTRKAAKAVKKVAKKAEKVAKRQKKNEAKRAKKDTKKSKKKA